tara:strand:- start:409 stop:1161 length:753 start_codon:yes stop_codon:yes gene_type:complete
MRCLAREGARLRPLDPAALRYGVCPGGDRRCRPVARVDARPVLETRAAGWIEASGDGYVLTREGTALVTHPHKRQTAAADQHRDLRDVPVMVDGQIESALLNLNESPLARWFKPGQSGEAAFLTPGEFSAGERFRADYHRSSLMSRVTSNWSGQPSGGRAGVHDPADAPVAALAAKERVFQALNALGPGLDRVIMTVCVREDGLERLERSERWPARSGKLALKIALSQLARHYGLDTRGDQCALAASASA